MGYEHRNAVMAAQIEGWSPDASKIINSIARVRNIGDINLMASRKRLKAARAAVVEDDSVQHVEAVKHAQEAHDINMTFSCNIDSLIRAIDLDVHPQNIGNQPDGFQAAIYTALTRIVEAHKLDREG